MEMLDSISLTKNNVRYIILYISLTKGGQNATQRGERTKGPKTPRPKCSKSSAPRSKRPSFSNRPVFRPQRYGSDQVRDVAADQSGRLDRHRSHSGLWLIEADFLPSTEGFQGVWPAGPSAPEARSKRSLQTDKRGNGLHGGAAKSRLLFESTGPGQGNRQRVQGNHSPPKHRTGAFGQKKTPRNGLASLTTTEATNAYESLRQSAITPGGKCHHAPGWAILVRQGVAGWLDTLSETIVTTPRRKPVYTGIVPDSLHNQVVRILAGMVLGLGKEVTHAV